MDSGTQGCPPWTDTGEHTSNKSASVAHRVLLRVIRENRSRGPDLAAIKSWHRELFVDFVPLDYYAGELRQLDISRPCLASNVRVDSKPGFHYSKVSAAMSSFSLALSRAILDLEAKWSTAPVNDLTRQLALVVGTAIGRFIQIHPFINGNGRTSRLLWAGLSVRYGFSPQVSIVRRPGPPYSLVMREAMTGNFGPAVALVLIALANTPRVNLNA